MTNTVALSLRRMALVLGTMMLLLPLPASAQTACTNCMGLGLSGGIVQASETNGNVAAPASGGTGFFEITISGSTAPNLPNTSYTGWCATNPNDSVAANASYAAASIYTAMASPLANEIDYILNNKIGTVGDVQGAIWGVLGTAPLADLDANSIAMYNAATSPAGQNFFPAQGQIIGVLLTVQNLPGSQNFLIEIQNPCTQLGDFVWRDYNQNGLQDAGEPGINGVTVQLQDSSGNLLATTVTSAAPTGYSGVSFTTTGSTNGYYQFAGLCQATYKVVIDNTQAALSGFTPTITLVNDGINPAIDSKTNPWTWSLTSPNENIDFGYVGPPLVVQCAGSTGQINVPYNSSIVTSGGVGPYSYSLAAGSTLPPGLSLNPSTGAITGTPTAFGTFSFSVEVTDSSGASAGTVVTNCSITIAPPPITLQCAANTGQVNVPYASALVAAGGTGVYTYSIISGSLPPGLTLNASTGAITGTPTGSGSYSFTAQVVDSSGSAAGTTTSNCTINVAPPALSLLCPPSTGTVGTAYTGSLVASNGTAPYTYSITVGSLPPGLTLNPTTGAITGTPTTSGPFSFTASVTDSTKNTAATTTSNCTITIAPPALSLLCPPSTGTVGTAYTGSLVASNGTAPYTYSITVGSLPPGLTLNPTTGAITGTPTTSGPFSFTASVTDSTKNTAATTTSNCTITIAPPALSLLCPPSTGTVGTAYTGSLVASNGTAPYTYSITVGSLPPGLTLNPATGAITGTPTTSGPFSFTASVTDSTKNTAATTTSNCTITIQTSTQKAPTLLAQCPSNAAQAGVAYSSSVVVTGGVPGYTFSVSSGSLPPGLTLNTTTGAITGTPTTSGSYGFTIKVVDSIGDTAYSTCLGTCGTVSPTAWYFNTPSGPLGNSQAYTVGGVTITAYGYTNSGSPTALYGNNNGGDQNGLGINSDVVNQIDTD